MKCLVTGSSGFIGRNLASALLEKGHDVYGLERYVTGRTIFKTHGLKTVFANLNDPFATHQAVRSVRPEAVFHLASLSPVAFSYDHPNEVMETNFLGTVNLAESCMREGCLKHFLFAGTSEEYGNQESFPINERAKLNPNSPYGVSKVAAENYLRYMRQSYDFPVTILRPFNTYGRTDNTHFIVENIISQALQNSQVILGDSSPVRDFIYVTDHVDAYLSCFDQPDASIGETFNFCTGRGTSIKELAQSIFSLVDFKGEVFWDAIPPRPLDIHCLVGDNSKAREKLGWKPRISLEEGLAKTVAELKRK
jgi:nucleoside-diphosphate-sugar epimerase